MTEATYRQIEDLLCTRDPEQVRLGLGQLKEEAGRDASVDVERLCMMVLPLFYIDTLDHPEYAPVIGEAVEALALLGEQAIPVLIQNMEAGDVKAQMALAQALGLMGEPAITPLIAQYSSGCGEPSCRAFLLYALGKVKSPAVLQATPLLLDAVASPELELRDTAARSIGKCMESIPAGSLPCETRNTIVRALRGCLTDASASVRAKAVRSLGKMARYGHLTPEQLAELKSTLQRLLGQDERFEWDRAYVVRKEATEAAGYV
jgi:HEAT repeat protein